MEAIVETFSDRYKAILIAYAITPSDLAELLNDTVAKYYQYRDGVKPRKAVLDKMLEKLPDLSPDYLYRGIGPVKLTDRKLVPIASSSGGEVERLRQDNQELKAMNSKLEARLEKLEAQFTNVNEQLAKANDQVLELSKLLNFLESSSQPPQYDHVQNRIPAGFRQQKDEQPIDRFHPGIRWERPQSTRGGRVRIRIR